MDRGFRDLLIGEDPSDISRLWQKMYVGTAMTGRRGALINAIGALDIALWDIAGKAAGLPCWKLFGAGQPSQLVPYASLQPDTSSFESYRATIVEWATFAVRAGFRAVKVEATFSGPYAHRGLREPDDRIAEVVGDVRDAIGPEVALMLDVQYAFDSVERALDVAEQLRELEVSIYRDTSLAR